MENGEASTQALGLSPMLAQLQKELSEAQSTGYTLGRQMSLICRELPPLPAQLSPFAEDSAQQSVRANLNTQHSLATTLKLEWQHSEDSSMDRCVSMDQDSACGTGDSDANEAKYNRLKSRYRQACDAHAEEVDRLNDEVAALQQHILKLDAARSQAQHNESTMADALAKTSTHINGEIADLCCENHALHCENQAIMQELVACKVQLAQLNERDVIWRRELFNAKETNKALAAKMGRLDALVLEIMGDRK